MIKKLRIMLYINFLKKKYHYKNFLIMYNLNLISLIEIIVTTQVSNAEF